VRLEGLMVLGEMKDPSVRPPFGLECSGIPTVAQFCVHIDDMFINLCKS